MNVKTFAASVALGLTLLGASPARAADRQLSARTATMVGQYIAQQGNAALNQIREELQQDLVEALKPLLPAPDQSAAETLPAKPRTH